MKLNATALSVSVALLTLALPATNSAAQSLAGTGFSWYASVAGPGCRILGGDNGKPFVFRFKSGQRYTFAQSCPKQVRINGPVKVYPATLVRISPGLIRLQDHRGAIWSVLKQGPGSYKVRRIRKGR